MEKIGDYYEFVLLRREAPQPLELPSLTCRGSHQQIHSIRSVRAPTVSALRSLCREWSQACSPERLNVFLSSIFLFNLFISFWWLRVFRGDCTTSALNPRSWQCNWNDSPFKCGVDRRSQCSAAVVRHSAECGWAFWALGFVWNCSVSSLRSGSSVCTAICVYLK